VKVLFHKFLWWHVLYTHTHTHTLYHSDEIIHIVSFFFFLWHSSTYQAHNTRTQPPLPLNQHDNPLSLQKACKPASSLLSLKHPKLVFIFVSKPLRTSSFLKITAAAAANLTCCNFQS